MIRCKWSIVKYFAGNKYLKITNDLLFYMKSETQLGFELGIDKRVIVSIRKRSLPRTLWFTKSNSVYYTLQGEHELRNEIQKTVLRLLDAWKASIKQFLSTTFSQTKKWIAWEESHHLNQLLALLYFLLMRKSLIFRSSHGSLPSEIRFRQKVFVRHFVSFKCMDWNSIS